MSDPRKNLLFYGLTLVAATLGTGTTFTGNILAYSSVTIKPGASLSGRAWARAGVTMDRNVVQVPR